MPALTNEDLQAIMGMGDIGGAENDQLRQQLLARDLRGSMGDIKGYRTGSNIGRAAYGIAGAMNDYSAGKATGKISTMKTDLLSKLLKSRQASAVPDAQPNPYGVQAGGGGTIYGGND